MPDRQKDMKRSRKPAAHIFLPIKRNCERNTSKPWISWRQKSNADSTSQVCRKWLCWRIYSTVTQMRREKKRHSGSHWDLWWHWTGQIDSWATLLVWSVFRTRQYAESSHHCVWMGQVLCNSTGYCPSSIPRDHKDHSASACCSCYCSWRRTLVQFTEAVENLAAENYDSEKTYPSRCSSLSPWTGRSVWHLSISQRLCM